MSEIANKLYYKGLKNLQLKNYEISIDYFNEAINIASNNFLFYIQRGFAKYYLNQIEESVSDFDQAIFLCSQESRFYSHIPLLRKVRQLILQENLTDAFRENLQRNLN